MDELKEFEGRFRNLHTLLNGRTTTINTAEILEQQRTLAGEANNALKKAKKALSNEISELNKKIQILEDHFGKGRVSDILSRQDPHSLEIARLQSLLEDILANTNSTNSNLKEKRQSL